MLDVRQVTQRRRGLGQERGASLQIHRHLLQPSRQHEGIHRILLRDRQRGHCHGRSPMIGAMAPERTWVRKPLAAASSSGVMIVGFTSRRTCSPTRRQAS